MNNRQTIAILLTLLLTLSGCVAKKHDDKDDSHAATAAPTDESQRTFIIQDKPTSAANLMEGKGGVVTVTMTERGYEPALITVKLGDEVRIYLKNKGTRDHNLVIPQFRIATSDVAPGRDNYIEFTANTKGDFPFFSDAPTASGQPEPGFNGTLKVE